MNSIQHTLAACHLFTGLAAREIEEISAQTPMRAQVFGAGEVVAFEEDVCTALGVVAEGSLHIQRIYADGRLITIETFKAGDSFGEALMFAGEGLYPATLVAKERTSVVFIAREEIVRLCSRYPAFLNNFLRILSDRILLLNRKIKNFSLQSIRQKLANFLLEESQHQKSDHLQLALSRGELADALGVPRPSLSREMILMREQGWIAFDRHSVRILDKQALESTLKS